MRLTAVFLLLLGASSSFANRMDLELEGIQNCANKCEKVFDRLQYAIADQPNANTFEFRSCLLGCNQCQKQLQTPQNDQTCFGWCKTYDYTQNGIRKGVIEPDKACIMGCVINTCQQVCEGGTTDHAVTALNSHLWWNEPGSTGCSIKSGLGYVQNPNYVNPNAPGGEGAAGEALNRCCANALNLCQYTGNKDSINYANVVLVTRRTCRRLVGSQDIDAICTFQSNAQNCGTRGMAP